MITLGIPQTKGEGEGLNQGQKHQIVQVGPLSHALSVWSVYLDMLYDIHTQSTGYNSPVNIQAVHVKVCKVPFL